MSSNEPLSFAEVIADENKFLRGTPEVGERTSAERGTANEAAPLSALCISGGGIRSATFALGVIQGLAEQGVLTEFDYLSTVSGGGYIGSWLTSWKERAGGLEKVVPRLCPKGPRPAAGELDPIEHLREYNNYLSPRLGFFSADTWTLVATVVRNMTLNWLVLVPLLMFALMAPRLVLALGRIGETVEGFYGDAAAPLLASLAQLIPIISGTLFAIAIFNTMRYLPGVGKKNHTEMDFLKWCLAPLISAALAFMTYDSWFWADEAADAGHSTELPQYWEMILWITGACAAGWLGYLALCVKGVKERFRLLCGPLSLAILMTGVGTATSAWLLSTTIYPSTSWSAYTTIGPPLLLLSFMAAGGLYVGFTSKVLEDEDREWLSRGAAWMLLFVVSWTALCGLVLIGPRWAFSLEAWVSSSIAAAGGLAGWICAVGGFGSQTAAPESAKPPSGLRPLVMDWAARLAAPVFIAVFIVALAILTNWILAAAGVVPKDWTQHELFLMHTRSEAGLVVALIFLLISSVAARYININMFSLHAMYRNRLIRAYLGASNDRSNANRFIGFNNSDNMQMHALTPSLKPFHIVNITLNLVSGDRLAWQQRKAESFTVSPLHCGSARLGYRPSRQYGGKDGISLGTAVTISGAAASPNMGYHSSPVLAFIMTLFNARLGAWLGNPGKAGAKTWRMPGPSSAVASLVKEAFGLTDDSSSYVYLSDGGHFENLGLYEMIMRRCRLIVVIDSSCDGKFTYDDLGNALRKVRIDMGIPIDFEDSLLRPLRKQEKRCAVASIRYSAVESGRQDGQLIYIKPMMSGNEPPDVTTYQASHEDFPHQSTGNQWYDESQTESYRMLGLHTVNEMCAGWGRSGGLDGLFEHVKDVYIRESAVRSIAASA